METRSTRKRSLTGATERISSSWPSNTHDASFNSDKQQQQQQATTPTQLPSPDQTPQKAKKRVRFSDPGPVVCENYARSGTTGLTPAMGRASIRVDADQQPSVPQTPSRRGRRRSAPSTRADTMPTVVFDPIIPGTPTRVQFTPLRQILTPRTQRHLWRAGLSEEMNKIESEKKEMKKNENKKLHAQIKALADELETYKSVQAADNDSNIDNNVLDTTIPVEDDTISDSVVSSDSPPFQLNCEFSPESDDSEDLETMSPVTPSVDSAIQVNIVDDDDQEPSEEMQALSEALSAARKEKQDLFNEWRRLDTGENERHMQTAADTPPADFMKQVACTLKAALKRASDANQIIEIVRNELHKMGFNGDSVEDVLSQMRQCIRSVRLDLESIIPGQTTAGLFDIKSTLEGLVNHLRDSHHASIRERKRAESLFHNHKALKTQFDQTLEKLESERERSKNHEETAGASPEDMLHVRMRMVELEHELAEKVTAIERFNQALQKYHTDNKAYEDLIEKLEAEKSSDKQVSAARIAELEVQVSRATAVVQQNDVKTATIEKSVQEKDLHINNLVERVRALEADNVRLVGELERREHEIGQLNVRYSQESTSLQSVMMDLENARRINTLLESQHKQEAEARDKLENWLVNVFENGKQFLRAEHYGAQARRTNMNRLLSDTISSEPDLPENSPSKTARGSLFGNVRVGRGKDQSTLQMHNLRSDILGGDSAIGMSTDDGPMEENSIGLLDEDEDVEIPDAVMHIE